MRTEYRTDPLGIDALKPRLSWIINADRRGEKQTAYQVLAASTRELLAKDHGDLWDSGKVVSGESVHVPYAGTPLESSQQVFWKVRSWDNNKTQSAWSRTAQWTMGLLKPEDWKAKWIQRLPESKENKDEALIVRPWLRKTFTLKELPERGLLTLNIAGYAELYINGRKVGVDVLTPAISEQSRQTFYVTYDVTKFLQRGPNVIGLWLGRGWADAAPMVRAQLRARVGGKEFILGTDSTWKCKASSYRYYNGTWSWGKFGGEELDARADLEGWSQPGFEDGSWSNAKEVAGPAGVVTAQQTPLNRIGEIIPAAKVTDIGGGQFEIDFGKCLTGWLRLKMPTLQPGATVKLSFADARNTEARRGASGYQTFNQVSKFISAGRTGELFENKFNYAGFRYVVVEGLPSAPAKEDASALLIESDLATAGDFQCSNELFNKIHRLTLWTQRCLNLGGYYVDCPTRERLGYGDGQVASEGFMTNFDASEFYRKWLHDWRLRQGSDGSMPNVAPCRKGGGGPAWPGLLAAITWRHYLYYGDRTILEENYDSIRRYVDFLETKCEGDILKKYGGQWDFIGDWVPPARGMDTKNWPGPEAAEFFNNCYRVYQWDLLAKMAGALGRKDEVDRCEGRIKAMRRAIHAAYYDAVKKQYVIDEQSYYVMPLMTGITPEKERPTVLQNLEHNILVKNQGHLDTGMLGTYFMMEYLCESGRNDLVFKMFNQTTYPGWGYMLAQGATTCWEQWNGYWSHIHSCFTSADNWFYQGPAGILPDPAGPGFKKTVIKPAVVGDLTWVNAHHDSPYGRITSNWKRDGDTLTMDVTIPANTTATIYVPARDAAAVTESGQPAAKAEGVKFLRMEGNAALYEIDSGTYRFNSKYSPEGKG